MGGRESRKAGIGEERRVGGRAGGAEEGRAGEGASGGGRGGGAGIEPMTT